MRLLAAGDNAFDRLAKLFISKVSHGKDPGRGSLWLAREGEGEGDASMVARASVMGGGVEGGVCGVDVPGFTEVWQGVAKEGRGGNKGAVEAPPSVGDCALP